MFSQIFNKVKPKKEYKYIPLTIFAGFWVTYIVARILIYLFPWIFANVDGVHIHHFSYGIILLSILGFYSLAFNPKGHRLYRTSFLFGVALGLTYDELGMWLKLTDNGVARFGYDAVALISIGFINFLYLDHHWKRLGKLVSNLLT